MKYKLELTIDSKLLKEQISDMEDVSCDFCGEMCESIEGVINLLGAIRDQIDPVQGGRKGPCCQCEDGKLSVGGFPPPCECSCHKNDRLISYC